MRKAFVLYTSDMRLMKKLNVMQRGILITAIAAYVSGEPLPDMDPATDMLFSAVADQIDRDTERYNQTVERRKEAAQKRWSMQKHANAGVADAVADAEAVAVAVAVEDAVADKDTRQRRGRNRRPKEQHDYDFDAIEADLLKHQKEAIQ